jgi:hypothetical protein
MVKPWAKPTHRYDDKAKKPYFILFYFIFGFGLLLNIFQYHVP